MQNNVLKLELGQPYYLAFKYSKGKPYTSDFGAGFTYTLVDGRVCFFPAEADAAIQALAPNPGKSIRITRRKEGAAIAWDVELAERNDGTVKVENLAVNSELPIHPLPVNGSAPPLTTRESQAFYRQLVASIEAAKSAEEHAARIGHPVTFSSEDIRALAISGFIQQAREGY
jgi:hypothetical protein